MKKKALYLIVIILIIILVFTSCDKTTQLEFSYSVPKTEYKVDETVNLTITLTNISNHKYKYFGDVDGPEVAFYFASCDGDDEFTCEISNTAEMPANYSIKSGQSKSHSYYITIPNGVTLGEYNLVLRLGTFIKEFERVITITE